MVIYPTLIQVIEAVDAEGRYAFTLAKKDRVTYKPATSLDALRDHLEDHFFEQPLFTSRLENVKRWARDIEARGVLHPDGNLTVSLDLARFLLLPAVKPLEELAELKSLLLLMQPFFETQSAHRPYVMLVNEVTRHGRSTGRLACLTRPDAGHPPVPHALPSALLQAHADASEVLTSFLHQSALTLRKNGPHSWVALRPGMVGAWSPELQAAA